MTRVCQIYIFVVKMGDTSRVARAKYSKKSIWISCPDRKEREKEKVASQVMTRGKPEWDSLHENKKKKKKTCFSVT